jgi:ABC-type dipeptide/oligopeptide/nickel transport system permease component
MITDASISSQIAQVFPYTLALAGASLAIGALLGIPIGVLAAIRRNTWIDFSSRVFALVGLSFPAFYLGIALLLIFSLWLGWFPIVHSVRHGSLGEHLYKIALPALTLGLIEAAYLTRITRSTMLEELRKDYIRTAHAKGLKPWQVFFKHGLSNALIPVVTAMGLSTGNLMGGAILTETVFNRPGLGRLLIGAIEQRDYNLVQGGLIVFAFVIVVLNACIDISYRILDPRVKYG